MIAPRPSAGRTLAATLLMLTSLAAPVAAQAPTDLDRGIAAYRDRNYDDARRLLEPIAKARGGSYQAAFHLGLIALDQDRDDEAVKWLEAAVKLQETGEAYTALGNAYGSKASTANALTQARLAGRIKGAFEKAVALDPDQLQARDGLVTFHLAAPGIMGGNTGEALRQAEEIRRRSPYRGGFALARVYQATDRPAEAERALLELAEAFPDSAAPRVQLAIARQGRQAWAEAMDVLRPMAAATPPVWAAVYQVGRTGALSGQYLDEAESALRRYMGHTPASGEPAVAAAWWRLGMVLQHRGDAAGARAAYQESLRLDPKQEEAAKALKALKG